ncbi:MAG: septal ring lytic transglycosylase RlpA family protein [Deltaproteobacteria bacterium]|nr:septal ring lytic transglycosylase RlpA family protein [Deltaproteobacteria bacterium]
MPRAGEVTRLTLPPLVALLLSGGCGAAAGALGPGDVRPDQIVATETGVASWYGARHHGRRTASGEPFDMHALTAAHRTLPFGTRCRVTSLRSGRSVIVRINDRGPYAKGRIIDLSRAAAEVIDMIRAGHVPVTVEVLRP